MISLLAAMDRNHVIGYQNNLPWHLPNDLKFFKQKTTGHTIIMGRKTFDSIGKALPNRRNVIISRKKHSKFPDGVEVIHDVSTIIEWNLRNPENELFVIGGEEIFKQVLPHADRLYITLVDDVFQGDTYFPNFSEANWRLTSREKGGRDSKNYFDHYFLQYDRQGE
ncbi:dihydrofolate reductase [Lentibacillus kapialis]|uniref:Dihydrofolate reductase n=1 Tax=Lentibacillus kapialis TaxID=340214 RepID=A0A917PNT2_9BACI|nr:dihydrofolate reductase [Lentibacillus kapialis]GGJ85300.1 dihydrofolate reductase [Lentibacillus kapialis]